METVSLQTVIGTDGKLRIEVPCRSSPGPAEVVVVIRPAPPAGKELQWRDFYGLGKEIWHNEDAQDYVNGLRDE
jgi:hypothetical protein